MKNAKAYTIENERWDQVVITAQLIIASVVCVIEILNNTLLYVTRSQGYGPDTIVEKLLRYLVVTTVFNFGMLIISKIVEMINELNNLLPKTDALVLPTVIALDICLELTSEATTAKMKIILKIAAIIA